MDIDTNQLKNISLDDTNKSVDAYDDSVVLSSYLKLLSNAVFYGSFFKKNELALFINSLQHWFDSRKHMKHKKNEKYKPGDIIEFECGINYSNELSYRHCGIVLEDFDWMVFVAPTTTGQNSINKTSEKTDGIWYNVLVGKNDGFDHDCVLLLNNSKMVSKSRIMSKFGNITKNPDGDKKFYDIKISLMSHLFNKQYNDLNSQINKLKTDLENRNRENEQLQAQIKKQKGKIDFLYKRIAHLQK